MKKIVLNNQEIDCDVNTLQELVSLQEIQLNGTAIAINNKVIQQSKWANTKLENGDKVIIIRATQGG